MMRYGDLPSGLQEEIIIRAGIAVAAVLAASVLLVVAGRLGYPAILFAAWVCFDAAALLRVCRRGRYLSATGVLSDVEATRLRKTATRLAIDTTDRDGNTVTLYVPSGRFPRRMKTGDMLTVWFKDSETIYDYRGGLLLRSFICVRHTPQADRAQG